MDTVFLYAIGLAIAVFLLYFLGISLAPYRPDTIKNDHFECGLPASSSQPRRANFGFFVYAVFFIVADMTGLFFTLFVQSEGGRIPIVAALFALLTAGAIALATWQLERQRKVAA